MKRADVLRLLALKNWPPGNIKMLRHVFSVTEAETVPQMARAAGIYSAQGGGEIPNPFDGRDAWFSQWEDAFARGVMVGKDQIEMAEEAKRNKRRAEALEPWTPPEKLY